MIVLVAGVAWADTWYPYEDGFVSETRSDAPTDALPLYVASYLPAVTATDGAAEEQTLGAVFVTGVGSTPHVALQPPAGGWVPGETYTLEAYAYTQPESTPGDPVATLTFTAGSALAPDAGEVTVVETRVGAWSEPTEFDWGCCEPVRTIEVDIDRESADPWSWTEIVGRFDLGRPSQITTEEIHTHLDLAMGSGPATLSFDQWRDGQAGPQPPCFDVVGVSAAGIAGPSESFCAVDDEVTSADRDDVLCGCSTTRAGWPVSALAFAAASLSRRARRPRGS